MKHAVLGAGGVGGLIAAGLAHSGRGVTLIVRSDHPSTLTLESRVLGSFEVPVSSARRLVEPVDMLWVTVKATQLEEALASAPAAAAPEALVVPLLNGIDHMEVLRSTYGSERVVAGAIRVESERVAPGRIRQPGPFIDLELAGPASARQRLEALRTEVSGTGIGCRLSESMDGVLWNKLAILGPLALCTTAAGLPLGGLRVDTVWRQRLIDCSAEVRAVAAALGVAIERGWEGMLDSAPGDMRSSMQKDAAAGNPVELDAIAGPVLREGRTHGVLVPVTEELAGLVRERTATQS
jgi:2-dehydropantoate 2-reductase